jgi:hypothetical protein
MSTETDLYKPLVDASLLDRINLITQQRDELAAALRAASSILWMAEKYAEAGGSRGPEMRDYTEAAETVEAALAGLESSKA